MSSVCYLETSLTNQSHDMQSVGEAPKSKLTWSQWSCGSAKQATSSEALLHMKEDPGPATLLSKGYASLFQKTLRKGLFL